MYWGGDIGSLLFASWTKFGPKYCPRRKEDQYLTHKHNVKTLSHTYNTTHTDNDKFRTVLFLKEEPEQDTLRPKDY
jgi:hypothetical protein